MDVLQNRQPLVFFLSDYSPHGRLAGIPVRRLRISSDCTKINVMKYRGSICLKSVVLALMLSGISRAQNPARDQIPPPDPELERATFRNSGTD